jgi:hypothetical protein
MVLPPAAERATAPVGLPAPREPAGRDTQPIPRRASPSGALAVNKPVHTLFDSSEAASGPIHAPVPATPIAPLPALPSDGSGGARPASASVSDPSGLSVISGGQPPGSATTAEARPVRLGYLIAGLAVLALLLALIIARIAGIWNKQAATQSEPASPSPPPESARPPPG